MSTDHSKQHYYEAVGTKGSDFGPWAWKVYHYDPAGNKEVVIARSDPVYRSAYEALDAASDWLTDHGIDAELV